MRGRKINFIYTVSLAEVLIPFLGAGIILSGGILFLYLHLKSKQKIYLGVSFMGLSAFFFVFGEAMIIFIGGILLNWNLSVQFHRLQQLGGAWFLAAFPYFISFLVTQNEFFKKINKFIFYAGLCIASIITLISFIYPDFFISLSAHNDKWQIIAANYGRGKEGIVYSFRDIILFLMIIYFYFLIVFNLIKYKNFHRLGLVFLGLNFAILGAIDDILFVYLNHYVLFFISHPFSRFSLGLVIFTICSMTSLTQNFVIKAMDQEKTVDELNRTEEKFIQIAENINEVFWLTNYGMDNILFVNTVFEKIWEIPLSKLNENRFVWFESVFPEDQKLVKEYFGNPHPKHSSLEYRIKTSRSVKWVRDNVFPVRDKKGKIYRWIRISEDITKYKEAENELVYMAYYDVITKIKNRKSFYEKLEEILLMASRFDKDNLRVLLYVDLDNFKQINDSFDHDTGDELLRQVSERLKQCIRKSDLLFRIGPDEFAIILTQISNEFDPGVVANKILESINKAFDVFGKEIFISVSIGIAIYPKDGPTFESIIKSADAALAQAKKEKNCFVFFDQKMNEIASKNFKIELHLKKAIQNNELILYFQPIIDSRKEIVKYEVLLRWNSDELGFVPPDQFIPVAENSGQIHEIGEWVLKATCKIIREYFNDNSMKFAVNISAKQLNFNDFTERMIDIINEYNILPQQFEFELTETAMMENIEDNVHKFRVLTRFGVSLSIDDFGTGHSSFAKLKKLPFHSLKIDKSFINDIGSDQEMNEIVKAIISMAHNLNLTVVAEGVETEAQFLFLTENQCDHIQGYYFSKPKPIEEIIKLKLRRDQ